MNRLTAETRLMCVIGHPVSHSLSPQIHNAFVEDAALPYVYLAFDILPEQAGDFLCAARLLNMAGCNVTMPLKEAVIPYLDELDEAARQSGAVNTIINTGGSLKGCNTDGAGFLNSLTESGFKPLGKAVILGSGGAAKAIATVLLSAGMMVSIVARNPRTVIPGVSCFHWNCVNEATSNASLIVNATPLGMTGKGDFEDFGFLGGLDKNSTVCDLVYIPRETALIRESRARGLRAVNGMPMLVMQAALTFSLITGHNPPRRIIERLLSCLS